LGVAFTALYIFRAMVLLNPKENDVWIAVISAAGGSLTLAFSKSYWVQSITAKGGIYILQSFVFLAAIYLIEKLHETPEKSKTLWVFPMLIWLVSLGATNGWEMMLLFCAAGLVYYLFQNSLKPTLPSITVKNIICLISLSTVGVSLYLFLPLRPGLRNILVWGNTQSWRGLLSFVSNFDVRQEAGLMWIKNVVRFSVNPKDWAEAWEQISQLGPQFNQISDHLMSDMGLWIWIPLVVGGWYFYRRGKTVFLFFGLMIVFLLIAANGCIFKTEDENLWCIDKFLIPANVFQAVCIGAGIGWLSSKVIIFWPERRPSNVAEKITTKKRLAWMMTTGLVFALFFSVDSLFKNFKTNDQSYQTLAYDYGSDLMKSLKKDSLFFAEGDNAIFSLLFFQGVLHQRMDVALIPADYLWTSWGEKALKEKLLPSRLDLPPDKTSDLGKRIFNAVDEIIYQNGGRRPIQFSANLALLDRCYFSHQPTIVKTGNLFSLLKPYGFSLYWETVPDSKGLDLLDQLKDDRAPEKKASAQGAMEILFDCEAQSYFNTAEYCSRVHLWGKADHFYLIALDQTVNPKLLGRIWEGRGDSLLARGKKSEALKAYQKSIEIRPESTNYAKLTRLFFNNGLYSEALKVALKSAEDFPNSTAALRDVAVCKAVLERKDAGYKIRRPLHPLK
jgi:tetratricopeptide (TPR) repeat protein